MVAKFSTQLKRIRAKMGRTQAEVAVILGVAPQRVSEWEREVRTPTLLTQDAIWVRLAKVKPRQRKETRKEVNRRNLKLNAKRKKSLVKLWKKK